MKSAQPPNHTALTQLLDFAARQPDRQAIFSWPGDQGRTRFLLNVALVPAGMPGDRRQWSSSLASSDHAPTNEPEWTLTKETDGIRRDLFQTRSSDPALVLTLVLQSDPNGHTQSQSFPPTQAFSAHAEPTLSAIPAMQQPRQTHGQLGAMPTSPEPVPDTQSQSQSALQLAGNLTDVDLPSILQSIGLCKMSGKLRIYGSAHVAEVFFEDGDLVHATSSHALLSDQCLSGDAAIVDLFSWDEGGFQFQPGWKANEKTVKKRMHSLMLEGAALSDYTSSLTKSGVNTETVLERTPQSANISDEELSAKFKDGLPVHLDAQKEIFAYLSQPRTVQSILDFKPMAKSAWVPVIFNLINLKLVKAVGAEGASEVEADPEFANVEDVIAEAYVKLVEPSGLLRYGHFLLLSRSELTRYQATEIPFSIAVVRFDSINAALPDNVLTSIADCFYEAAQPIDVLSVKDSRRLFVLLPHSEETIATNTMQKFLKNLFVTSFPNGLNGSTLGIRIGVASVPTDGDDFVQLLTMANSRCNHATPSQPLAAPPT